MDISNLEKDVQKYFEQGLATSTRKTYQAGIKKFRQFCVVCNIQTPLPVSQPLLCLFISFLANNGLSYGTIKTYLSAVRYLHIANDYPEPEVALMPKLKLVERGIRKINSKDFCGRQEFPITPSILQRLRAIWESSATSYETIMMWAVCCTAFFGFFRLGELLEGSSSSCRGPTINEVATDSHDKPSMVMIHLRTSKTDQFSQGVDIYLGATGTNLCPVAALLAYVAVRNNGVGPLFIHQDGRNLTKSVFITKLRSALSALGFDERVYAGHILESELLPQLQRMVWMLHC